MLIAGILVGLFAGLALGGRLDNLANVRLRLLPLLFGAVIVRFLTETALAQGSTLVDSLRIPLLGAAYVMLLGGLWANRTLPGLALAFVGILSNAIAIAANGGHMPIWQPSLAAAGLSEADVGPILHVLVGPNLDANFLLSAGPLGDILPINLPLVRNVASIGDIFLSVGLAFFLFAIVLRDPERGTDDELELQGVGGAARLPRTLDAVFAGRGTVRPGTGLATGLSEAAALERPLVLGGTNPGLSGPAFLPEAGGAAAAVLQPTGAAIPVPARPSVHDRARTHPYVQLALNGSFSALWSGQLISLFGDRIHQVALGVFVFTATQSPLAVALAYLCATIPNLFFSPVAGTFVDRWDQKEVLVVSDLLRAALVLLIPVAATINLLLVYPIVFLVTTISIFFRPARIAVVPRIVRDKELLAANSALWLGETIADVVGYAIAAVFTGFLGRALPLAFWFDAATYIASGVLIYTIAVPPLKRERLPHEQPSIVQDMRDGWRFLRREPVLLASTVQGVVGQFAAGTLIALTLVYVARVLNGQIDATVGFALLEGGIGIGNFIGGFVLGLVAGKLRRGPLIIAGYLLFGVCVTLLSVTQLFPVSFGLLLGCGIANMVFVIPTQTLFQERVPAGMIGRIAGFRSAAIYGSLTLAMALAGGLSEALGPQPILGLAGLLSIAAGLGGLLFRPLREA